MNVRGPAADWRGGIAVAMIDQKLGGVSKQSGTGTGISSRRRALHATHSFLNGSPAPLIMFLTPIPTPRCQMIGIMAPAGRSANGLAPRSGTPVRGTRAYLVPLSECEVASEASTMRENLLSYSRHRSTPVGHDTWVC